MESPENPEVIPETASMSDAGTVPSSSQDTGLLGFTNDGMWPEYCNPTYRMPDEIEVKVTMATGDYYFPVQIIKSTTAKTYLGGYRHKLNGRIYHHANSQTPPEQKKVAKVNSNLTTRETQTSETRTLSVQCYRECGTQMERIDLRLDNKRDVEIIPKKYFTSTELLALKKEKSIIIQKSWRGYMARCVANRIRRRNIEIDRQAKEDRQAIKQTYV